MAFALVTCGSSAAVYEFIPGDSSLTVWVPRAGLLSFAGHDHTITARTFDGQLDWSPSQPQSARLLVNVTASSLTVTDEDISRKTRDSIQQEMQGKAVLDHAQHAEIHFQSTQITTGEDGNWEITGNLSLRGITREITFKALVHFPSENSFVATGNTSLRPGDFGIRPVKALAGMVRTSDTIEIRFHIEGRTKD